MTEVDPKTGGRAASLRQAFDQLFAEPPRRAAEEVVPLLRLRVGGDAYALRLGEITGLFANRRIAPFPAPVPELLGLMGLRGAIVPVYGLDALLGYGKPAGSPRWVVVAEGGQVALAFGEMDGYVQLPRASVSSGAEGPGGKHCSETARSGDESFSIIGIHSVVKTITERVAALRAPQER